MSVIGMNSRGDRNSKVTNRQIIIDKLKKVRKDYKIEENKNKKKILITRERLNEVFELIDKL
tara:strand:- start:765 stop:950 length:186 start_codon:yes stop_codon:yes gene_type:complete